MLPPPNANNTGGKPFLRQNLVAQLIDLVGSGLVFFNTDVVCQVFSMSRNLSFERFALKVIVDQKDEIAFVFGPDRCDDLIELRKAPPTKNGLLDPFKIFMRGLCCYHCIVKP